MASGHKFDNMLISAVSAGDLSAVQHALRAGANPNTLHAGSGRSALYYAAGVEDTRIAGLLLDRGATCDVADDDGFGPLHVAVAEGRTAMVRLLLEKGANINLRDGGTRNLSPLHVAVNCAVRTTSADMIVLLIQSGADETLTDGRGRSAVEQMRQHLDKYPNLRGAFRQMLEAMIDRDAQRNRAAEEESRKNREDIVAAIHRGVSSDVMAYPIPMRLKRGCPRP